MNCVIITYCFQSNISFNFGLEGLGASESTIFPFGSNKINLGIALIPYSTINLDSKFLSANN